MGLETYGRHLLAEYRGCDPQVLDDVERVEALMQRAALAASAHILQSNFHRFSPQGVSGVIIVEESHLSIHTWPEACYAAVDFFSCGEADPRAAHLLLSRGFAAAQEELVLIHRGDPEAPMRIERPEWLRE